ncbi:hypothetical protein [Deinococcus aquatilis]|uniref:hypothetical protein n=1 Tax=Deinococcus aquatilis TaxID=519440 RepID=UPI001FDFA472|nr:hypothetical protein [Deinococcus aquatilis]
MKRAQQRFLGLPSPRRSHSNDEALPIGSLGLLDSAYLELMQQVNVLGRWQGGTLFGEVVAGHFTVQLVTPLGPPSGVAHPLFPHLPYLLGWSDCVAQGYGEAMDWYGNWLAAPDGRLPDERADLSWLALGASQGLFDEQHALLVLGMHEGQLLGRAYCWQEGQRMNVTCSFGLRLST